MKFCFTAFILFVFSLFIPFTASAQDFEPYDMGEIIVTGVVEPAEAAKSATNVIVITAEDIARMQPAYLEELFRSIPTLNVTTSGSANTLSVGIRGSDSSSTLVLLDGIPFSDPAGTGSMSLWMLPPSMIERIEIVTGPASAQYGSGAMSGVINIITKDEKASQFTVTGGSHGAYGFSATAVSDYFTVGGDFFSEKGISASAFDDEDDAYTDGNLYARHNFTLGRYSHEISAIYNRSKIYFDDDSMPADYYTDTEFIKAGYSSVFKLNKFIEPSLILGYMDLNRDTPLYSSFIDGYTVFGELNNRMVPMDWFTLVIGAKVAQDHANSSNMSVKKETTKIEAYINSAFEPQVDWNIYANVRYSDLDELGSRFTYSLGTSYLITPIDLTLRASHGTGFNAPNLDQLYGQWGNPDLKAEKSSSWEIGFSNGLFDRRIVWGMTYFDTKYDDKITFASNYNNADRDTNGVEANLKINVFGWAEIAGSYAYVDFEDRIAGVAQRVARRPHHRANASLSVYPIEGLRATLEADYVSERNDNYYDPLLWTSTPVTMKSYTLLNLYVNYYVDEDLSLFFNALNLTDKEYQTAYGYNMKRFNMRVGATYTF